MEEKLALAVLLAILFALAIGFVFLVAVVVDIDRERLRERLGQHFNRGDPGLRVEVGRRTGGSDEPTYPLTASLRLRHVSPEAALRVRRRADVDASAGEGSVGAPNFDATVHTEGDEAMRELLRESRIVRVALAGFLAQRGARSLELSGGRLVARLDAWPTFGKRPIGRLREGLRRVAELIDHAEPLTITRLEARAPRVEPGRCPYCFDELSAAPLLVCGDCGTKLHAECHAENKGCPVLGCGGRRTGRLGA